MSIFKPPVNKPTDVDITGIDSTTSSTFTIDSDSNGVIIESSTNGTVVKFIPTNEVFGLILANIFGNQIYATDDEETYCKMNRYGIRWNDSTNAIQIQLSADGVKFCDDDAIGIPLLTGDIKFISSYGDPPTLALRNNNGVLELYNPQADPIVYNHVPVYHGSSASAPTGISAGDEYYNTGDSKFYKYNGTDWIALN